MYFRLETHGCLISIPLHQGIIEQVGRRSGKYVGLLVDSHRPAGPLGEIPFVGLADIINLCMDSVIQRGCSTLENSLEVVLIDSSVLWFSAINLKEQSSFMAGEAEA